MHKHGNAVNKSKEKLFLTQRKSLFGQKLLYLHIDTKLLIISRDALTKYLEHREENR